MGNRRLSFGGRDRHGEVRATTEQTEQTKQMEQTEQTKRCSHCKKEKPITEFSKRSASKDGLSYTCKACERETSKRSYKRRKEQRKRQRYYREHREEILQRSHENYMANREARLAFHKEYRVRNPGVLRRAEARRRKRLKEAESDGVSREEIIKRDSVGGVAICQICGKPILKFTDLHIDHIVPLGEGGSDTADNKRVVHKSCNLRRPKDGRDLKPAKTTQPKTTQPKTNRVRSGQSKTKKEGRSRKHDKDN